MGNSSIDARALAAPNLKDLPRRRRPLDSLRGRMRSGGQFCPRGETHPRRAMDCSLWEEFPSPPIPA
jgi:hypothetical protein